VVIAGGGLSGCDAGLELAMKGKNVTIVEMLERVARDLNAVNRLSLLRLLEKNKVSILTEHRVKKFHEDGLVAEKPDGKEVNVGADTIITAFGMLPDDTPAAAIRKKYTEVYTIGDCVRPAKVGDAVRAGFAIGRRIE
jgi:pyruvate/2-oxoglutarate dehydrogenase complex dihydrolipoamide dehydrogenase (E3) component